MMLPREVARARQREKGLNKPYVDPGLRKCPREYVKLVKRLHARKVVQWGLHCEERVGIFSVW